MNKDYGFSDELDNLDISDWQPSSTPEAVNKPGLNEVKKVAEKAGFTSREPQEAPKKEPEGQITIRGKQSVMDAFRDVSASQEPKWPLGYTLERALLALQRELQDK